MMSAMEKVYTAFIIPALNHRSPSCIMLATELFGSAV